MQSVRSNPIRFAFLDAVMSKASGAAVNAVSTQS